MTTKDEILMAAAEVFKEHGYDKATMRAIAIKVGIKQPSLYHYINSKDELLYEIVKKTTQKGIEQNMKIQGMKLPADQKIRLCVKTHFNSLMKSYPQVSVLIHEKISLLPKKREKEIRSLYKKYVNIISDILQDGIEKGLFKKDMDIKLITWALLGMINWVYKWGKIDGPVHFDKIAEMYSELFLRGIVERS